jgi:hypothetical protein
MVAIAEGQKDKEGITVVNEEHFRSTAKMSKAFKDYLVNFSGGRSEAQVARWKGKR